MNIIWTGSPNYWAGRTQKVSKIAVHWMDGNLAGTDKQFQANVGTDAATSAHYGIENGLIHQYVNTDDTAWHARQANPFSIGIEHSAQPGRDASDDTYMTSIQLISSLCAKYKLTEGAIVPHSLYVATKCPGTVDIDRIKAGVKKALNGSVESVPAGPQPDTPVANTTTKGTVSLPANATSWRVYSPKGPYTVGSELGKLNPSLFGGLIYEIQGNPTANVYLITTRDYGQVAIYAGPETGAMLAVSGQGIQMGNNPGKTVTLPAVLSWRVYKENGPYTAGNEIGYLAPAKYGGLSYAVLSQPVSNVAVIQTQTFGRVAIYVGSDSGATIK